MKYILGIWVHKFIEVLFVESEMVTENVVAGELRVDQLLVDKSGVTSQLPFAFKWQPDCEVMSVLK